MKEWRVVAIGLLLSGCAGVEIARDGGERGLGCVLSTPEQLRRIVQASTPFSGDTLPPAVDLSADLPPPGNQGTQNSCVAWAVAYALKSYQERIEEKRPYVTPAGSLDPRRIFSPGFIYNQINNGRNGGCTFPDALNLMRSQGAAPWADTPYEEADFTRQPTPEARTGAGRYRIDDWRQIDVADENGVKAQLHAGFPVLFAARVDEGFMKAGKTYVWKAVDGPQGTGHAMVLVGYDDRRNAFKLLNSWGPGWGDGGYGWIDYGHFGRIANEAYTVKDSINAASPTVTPTTPPTAQIEFVLTQVTHNLTVPGSPEQGYFMRFDGTLSIPPGVGRFNQSVIWFFWDAGGATKGEPVKTLLATYGTAQGDAACGTAAYPIPAEGVRTSWAAWIPYNALHLWAGSTQQTPAGPAYEPVVNNLLAEPVLFVDNYGVRNGGLVSFTVKR